MAHVTYTQYYLSLKNIAYTHCFIANYILTYSV